MKKIVIITHQSDSAMTYQITLEMLFLNNVEIESYAVDDIKEHQITADIVLVSAYFLYEQVRAYISDTSYLVIVDLSLTKNSLIQLDVLPKGTRAILVNSTLEMAVDTIKLIHNFGLTHLELYPYYPDAVRPSQCQVAITPGETSLVPSDISTILDIGDRVLSMETIVQLAGKLNLEYMIYQKQMVDYFSYLYHRDIGLERIMSQVLELEKQLEIVGKIFDGSILALDRDGRITFINPSAEKLLNIEKENCIGCHIQGLIPQLNHDMLSHLTAPLKDKIIEIDQQLVTLSIYTLRSAPNHLGYLALIRRLTDVEKQQDKIRRQVIDKGHVAKYTFDDIVTISPVMLQLKEMAKKMAQSNSSIHIYGKSGTGKELFAQSIHQISMRKDKPFIAINCAAIPVNLLESELFGYAEGAFTGAKRGGKPGYFELADKGTLFLDEISEMEYSLQTRLLRTLQEKEVVRVGGDRVIPVDVRIISASNKELRLLVKENKFREDLFYRLDILQLKLPNLADRSEDIKVLIQCFKEEFDAEFEILPEALAHLEQYPWDGNIRELHNFVERITYLGKSLIDRSDIASHLGSIEHTWKKSTWRDATSVDEIRRFATVLSALEKKGNIGRKRIAELIHHTLTEQEIRLVLERLEKERYIVVGQGRQGSSITSRGLSFLTEINEQ